MAKQQQKKRSAFSFLGKARAAFGAKDLPVFSMVARAGVFRLRKTRPTERPGYLRKARQAYALRIRDATMAPALEPGWLIYVDPDAAPKVGDNVVARLADGVAVVRRLLRKSRAGVTLRQFNPRKTTRLAAATLAGLHRIVGIRYRR